jgi:hypothetical protein
MIPAVLWGLLAALAGAMLAVAKPLGISDYPLSRQALVKLVLSPADIGTTGPDNTITVDMQDYDHCDFYLLVGALTGTLNAAAQTGDASDGSDAAALSPAVAITQLEATDDDVLVIVAVHREQFTGRYLRLQLTPAGGTTNFVGVVAVRYPKSGGVPVTQEATTDEVVAFTG